VRRRARLGLTVMILALASSCSAGAPTRISSGASPPSVGRSRPSALPCQAKSLEARAGRESDGAAFAASSDVEVTNVGIAPCRLRGTPTVDIVRTDGKRLDLRYVVAKARPNLRPAVLPVGKPGAASIELVWLNWCGENPGSLTVRIVFPRSRGVVVASFDGPPGYDFVPRCESASTPSRLELISAYR
jgi:hypothetical protein